MSSEGAETGFKKKSSMPQENKQPDRMGIDSQGRFREKNNDPFAVEYSNKGSQIDFFGGGQTNQDNNFLPKEYQKVEEDFDFFQMGEDEINKQVKKYEQKQYIQEA